MDVLSKFRYTTIVLQPYGSDRVATEAVHLRASLAERAGSVIYSQGSLRLDSTVRRTFGTVTYPSISADEHVLWKSAELRGVHDQSTDAVRVRLSNGTTQYFIDEDDDMTLKPVTDTTQWDTEFSTPYHLGSLDLWTQRTLSIIVHMVATPSFPRPSVKGVDVLMDLPAWAGAVAHAVKAVVQKVATIEPIMVERFPFGTGTLSEATQEFKIGDPHSEHGYSLTSLVQVLVDGTHKSASLSNGIVTLLGPPAPPGSVVKIAVKYLPNTSVRRVGEVQIIDRTPAWVVSGLVVEDGLDGLISPLVIAGYEVFRRKVELRITVNGVAHRQADALAMRLALQSELAEGLLVRLPSGRCLSANLLDGVVEVIPQGSTNLPMASTIITLALDEFPRARLVKNARSEQDDGSVIPVLTQISIDLPGGVSVSASAADFTSDP